MESTCPPVRPRYRSDGWTPARRTAFVDLLEQDCTIEAAARAVGLSRQTAYATRARSPEFAAAWDAALAGARAARIAASPSKPGVLERAVDGVATPVFYGRRQVGEVRRFDHRAMFDPLRRQERARGSSLESNVSPKRRCDPY